VATERPIGVYVERGQKKCFAGVIDWPGWCRSARDEEGALQALVDYFPRYAAAIALAGKKPGRPAGVEWLEVIERLEGDASTDFGAPSAIPEADHRPLDGAELARQLAILAACWEAFEAAAEAARGARLATGPRGGGRDLAKIREHVDGGDGAYLSRLGGQVPREHRGDTVALRAAFVEAVRARAGGGVPDVGPRGGARWPARYGIRRSAWHVLDHAWEIEDRAARPSR